MFFEIGRLHPVKFTYPGSDREVLHNISITIRGSEKISVVGDNGSDKSTFISVLTGLFSPNQGQVTIDGLPLAEHKQTLRNKISVIFQDFAYYEATLRENITVSDDKRKLTDDEIIELAQQVHVEDVAENCLTAGSLQKQYQYHDFEGTYRRTGSFG